MKKILSLILLCSSFFLYGCQFPSPHMTLVDEENVNIDSTDKATITFYRDTPLGVAIQAPLGMYKKNENDMEFIGIISNGTKVTKVLDEGQYHFILLSEFDYMIEANLEKNKHYYVEIVPIPGWIKANFKGYAIRKEQLATSSVQNSILGCSLAKINENGFYYFKAKRPEFLRRFLNEKVKFDKKPYKESIVYKEDGSTIFY